MKKAFGIVLLILVLLQVGGGYVYFIARLSAIHREAREKLTEWPDHELTLFTLSESEYQKAKVDDHEVKVDGKMYDIARVERKDEQILVYAVQDKAEDNLLAFVREMVDQSTSDKKPVPTQYIQLLTLDFILIENEFPENSSKSISHTSNYLSSLLNCNLCIESPPPRAL